MSTSRLICSRLHDQTYKLIAGESDYGPFSNNVAGSGTGYLSLETIHDEIHAMVGNGGHMSFIPYSSFDPIFWLHHA